ncbi:MAG: branched-chain amino acid ABC transporter permease [Chloroflexota bacterium]|nr:branched-chain amino acid ABC transporter permease [Chloroflexota bacterium]
MKARRSYGPLRVLLYVLLLLLAIVVPPAVGNFVPQQVASYLIFGLFALSVGLVTGFARLFNIGVGATFGVASYAVALLAKVGVTEPVVLLLAAVAGGLLVSGLFGVYSILTSGTEYLMLTFLTTLAFFEIPTLAPTFTGADNGLSIKGGLRISFGIDPLHGNNFYFFVLGIVAFCVALSLFVMASQAGKAMIAIGRNPGRAAAMGYDVHRYRVAFTLFSGFLAAIAGWLYALQTAFVFSDLLGLANSLNGLVYALIGGIDTILGPIFGAAALRGVSESLSRTSTQSSLYVGVVLMVVVYFMPDGLVGLWRWALRKLGRGSGARGTFEEAEETGTPVLALTEGQ